MGLVGTSIGRSNGRRLPVSAAATVVAAGKRAFWVEWIVPSNAANQVPLSEIQFVEDGSPIASTGAVITGANNGDPATQGIAKAFDGITTNDLASRTFPPVPGFTNIVYPAAHRPQTIQIFGNDLVRFKVRWGDPGQEGTTGGQVIYDQSAADYNTNGGAALTLVYP